MRPGTTRDSERSVTLRSSSPLGAPDLRAPDDATTHIARTNTSQAAASSTETARSTRPRLRRRNITTLRSCNHLAKFKQQGCHAARRYTASKLARFRSMRNRDANERQVTRVPTARWWLTCCNWAFLASTWASVAQDIPNDVALGTRDWCPRCATFYARSADEEPAGHYASSSSSQSTSSSSST
jgi:hypothetical protein